MHVSDIHFRGYDGGWDLNQDQRNELLRDVAEIVKCSGDIDGIVVGGDIAFQASPEEYRIADAWLSDLRNACGGLDTGRIWTVPGNHDVHRATISSSVTLQEFRSKIRDCELNLLDDMLNRCLAQDPAAESLSLPLKAYNEFAGQYTCSVTSHEPHWHDDTLECDGLRVHLIGINSVLISDQHDDDKDERSKLVLGLHQCQIPRQNDTLNITMMHHPPSWIRDWANVEQYLRRSHVMLFGHEHAFAARQQSDGVVEVFAGAVGPERRADDEHGAYVPTYNVLTLERRGQDTVSVCIEPRVWDEDNTCFVEHQDGRALFTVSTANATPKRASDDALDTDSQTTDVVQARSANPLDTPDSGHAPASRDPVPRTATELRRLGTEYMRLSWTDRVHIARNLQVLEDEDLQLDAVQLFPLLLTRIRERGLISKLEQELDRG